MASEGGVEVNAGRKKKFLAWGESFAVIKRDVWGPKVMQTERANSNGGGFSSYIVLTDGQDFYATLNIEYGREIERINAVLNV